MALKERLVAVLILGILVSLTLIVKEQTEMRNCMQTGFVNLLERTGSAEIHIHPVNQSQNTMYHLVSGTLQLHMSQNATEGDQLAHREISRDTQEASSLVSTSSGKLSSRRKVLLFAYMKGGSTFVGQLFNQYPNSMYLYEPVAGLYSALYGSPDWTFPLKVLANSDGSFRSIPTQESETITSQMKQIFNCEVTQLPLELLQHQGLWLSSSTFEYRRCLLDKVKDQMGKQNDTRPMDHMMHTLQPYCPDSIQVCAERGCDIFMNLSRNIQSGGLFLNKLHQSLRNETLLQDFIRTRKVFKAAVDSCVEKLHIPCVTSQLLVVKALRLTMNTVRILLRDDPDLRLVYLVRDPRGILQSRKTVRYLTEGLQTDLNREAALLCPKMTRDLSGFEKLKQEFAERVLLLRYEDAADQPQEVVDRVYEFIGLRPSASIKDWVLKNTQASSDGGNFDTKRANSSATAHAWRRRMTQNLKSKMDKLCIDILLNLSYHV